MRRRVLKNFQSDKPPPSKDLQLGGAGDGTASLDTAHGVDDLLQSEELHEETAQEIDMSFDVDELEKPSCDGDQHKENNTDDLHQQRCHGDVKATRSEFREFRESDELFDDNTLGFQVSCQDTGYQTYSLQSVTNPDLMGCSTMSSTNITGQFSSLPTAFSLHGASKDLVGIHRLSSTRVEEEEDDAEQSMQMNSMMENDAPFSNVTQSTSPSEDVEQEINNRPSSLIFSELQNLANRFPPLSPCQSSGSDDARVFSQSGVYGKKSGSTAWSVHGSHSNNNNNYAMPPPSGRRKNDGVNRVGTGELCPADKAMIAKHLKKYTEGSMINHEQIYEPPVYVTTSQNLRNTQPASSSLLGVHNNGANPSSFHLHGKQHFTSLPDLQQWHFSDTSSTSQSTSQGTIGDSRNQRYDHPNTTVSANVASTNSPPASYFVPPKEKLYHGRPAHINPAFKIETLTPSETEVLGDVGVPNDVLAEKLLSPDEHPPSPCPTVDEALAHTQGISRNLTFFEKEVSDRKSLFQTMFCYCHGD